MFEGSSVGNGRGLIVMVLDPATQSVEKRQFDTHGSSAAAAAFVSFIASVPIGHVVVTAVRDSAAKYCYSDCLGALRSIGGTGRALGYRGAFAIIGRKGSTPGSAEEAMASSGNGPVSVSSNLPAVTVFKNTGFMGTRISYGIGAYSRVSLNDAISSLTVPPGMKAILFTDVNFKGRSQIYNEGGHATIFANDAVSSLKVELTTAVMTGRMHGRFIQGSPGYIIAFKYDSAGRRSRGRRATQTVTSDGSKARPYCTWSSVCNWDTATKNKCANKLCVSSGFVSGTYTSASNNMCSSSFVSGTYWVFVADTNEVKQAGYANDARITASCSDGETSEPGGKYTFADYNDKYVKMTQVDITDAMASATPASPVDKYIEVKPAPALNNEIVNEMWNGRWTGGGPLKSVSGDGYEVQDVEVVPFAVPVSLPYHAPEERRLRRNTLIAVIDVLPPEYVVSFELKIFGAEKQWASILHGTTGQDNSGIGSRVPGFWMRPGSTGRLYYADRYQDAIEEIVLEPEIELSGRDVDSPSNLKACSGECDYDSECAAGLKCFQRSNGEKIPGCKGAGGGRTWDYCYSAKWHSVRSIARSEGKSEIYIDGKLAASKNMPTKVPLENVMIFTSDRPYLVPLVHRAYTQSR